MIWLTKAMHSNTPSGELPAAGGHRGIDQEGQGPLLALLLHWGSQEGLEDVVCRNKLC